MWGRCFPSVVATKSSSVVPSYYICFSLKEWFAFNFFEELVFSNFESSFSLVLPNKQINAGKESDVLRTTAAALHVIRTAAVVPMLSLTAGSATWLVASGSGWEGSLPPHKYRFPRGKVVGCERWSVFGKVFLKQTHRNKDLNFGLDFCIFSILFKISPGPLPLRWLCRQMPISTDAGDVARVFPPAERKNEENEMQRQFHQFPSNFPKDRMNFDDGKIGWCANFLTSEKYRTCRTCRSCNWLNLQSVCEWPHPIWSESSKDSRMCVSTTRQRCSKS